MTLAPSTPAPLTAAGMARIHAACFTMPRPWDASEFATALADPRSLLIHEDHGFALGRIVADEAELLTLAVAPDARRQGTGARLMAAFLVGARARGAESVFLEVAAPNTAARALYEKCGFAQTGLRRGYYRDAKGRAVDAVVLVWGI